MEKPKPPHQPNGHKGKNARPRTRSLGPVVNLEDHLSHDWWNKIFNHLYLKTDGDVVGDAAITRAEVDQILKIMGLSPREDRILDLCCGQGRHTLELARRGFRMVEGIDRSHYLIQRARESARSEGLGVRFREGDARKLPYGPDTFDTVLILGNSFGYFETLQDDLKVLREVFRVMKPWGKLMIDLADGDFLRSHFQKRSWEWIDNKLFVCRERSLSQDSDRLVSREVITHVEKGVVADQFYAERLYSRDSIAKLLADAGFSTTDYPAELSPDSQRNQDLGMMERRIAVTAQVRKDWTPLRRAPRKETKSVVVVMGDPTRPDRIKPESVFDDDDYYTIDRMKEALYELEGYQFSFLNNHDTLIADLSKLAGRVDYAFNLCDEGYANDARLELHVPSLLEMLGIPYTGSGPQCLAYCYDKSLVRGIAKEMEIPVPAAFFITAENTAFELPFDFPVIVKPNFGDSSFGITVDSVAHSAEQLLNAVQNIRSKFGYEKPILVEELLTGKDLSVGIIGTPPASYVVLPITEEDYSCVPDGWPKICGYEAKWDPNSPYWKIKSVPADLEDDVERLLVGWCVKLAERLECRDYVRLDWRIDSRGTPKLLEVNPNPGWCWDGHLAKMAGHVGWSYGEMLEAILMSAETRLGLEPEENLRQLRQHLEKRRVEDHMAAMAVGQ